MRVVPAGGECPRPSVGQWRCGILRSYLKPRAFHLIGLALEVFKVHTGSWAYPDAGMVRIGGVPVFSGFMDTSVGSSTSARPSGALTCTWAASGGGR